MGSDGICCGVGGRSGLVAFDFSFRLTLSFFPWLLFLFGMLALVYAFFCFALRIGTFTLNLISSNGKGTILLMDVSVTGFCFSVCLS
jgi:hypothetical protein